MKNKIYIIYQKVKIFGTKCFSALQKLFRFLFISSFVFFAFHYFVNDNKTSANAQGETLSVYISYVLPPINDIDSTLTSPNDVKGSVPNSYLSLNTDLVPTTFNTYTYSEIVVSQNEYRSFTSISYSVYYNEEQGFYYVQAPPAETIKGLYFADNGYPSVIEYNSISIYGDTSMGLISDYCITSMSSSRLSCTIYQRYYRDNEIVLTVEFVTTADYLLTAKTYYSEPFLLVADVPSADVNGYNLGYYKGYYKGYDDALAGIDDVRSPIARIVDGVNSFMRLEIIPNVSISFLLICAFGFLTIRLMLSIK